VTAGEAGRVEQSKANDGMARNPCPVLSFLIEFPFRLRFFFFFRRGGTGSRTDFPVNPAWAPTRRKPFASAAPVACASGLLASERAIHFPHARTGSAVCPARIQFLTVSYGSVMI
jgi:hypothetical protein